MKQFSEWPIEELEESLRRPELNKLKDLGYKWDKPHEVVNIFERLIAEYAGSKYAVAIDCATHGLELAVNFHNYNNQYVIYVPKYTYVSVPTILLRAGHEITFTDEEWYGTYRLDPLPIVDGAARFTKNMYEKGSTHILSFQYKKRLPIGRGGMILTDSEVEYNHYKKMVYDGRDLNISYDIDEIDNLGYHYYMTPEDAARGIILFHTLDEFNDDTADWQNYPNLCLKKPFRNDQYHVGL